MFDLQFDKFESSNIADLKYDTQQNILRATFKGGVEYDYANVPDSVVEILQRAESKGKAFNLHVKKGNYEFKKVTEV